MSHVSGLFTDLYSLTMAQGYWKSNMSRRTIFEMFFRRQPFAGGFSIFAGFGTLLDKIQNFYFSKDDLDYLRSLNLFEENFLEFLKQFRFSGSIWAMDEGTVIFPQEVLIRIDGTLIECQIIEGLILNTINFQSLIATKTARVWLASGKGKVMEFGLRRAQGADGALSASRAAFVGGAVGTSNVLAGKEFGIPVMGTMAHSWVMAHQNEEEAFRSYADIYPNHPVFLIDTYDTLKSGIINAIKVGKRLAEKGKTFGVRLDSGDIHYLSVEVRKMLDNAFLTKATISVSNDLDESIVRAMTDAGAPVNVWGVGTQMVTGGTEAAFTGVFKLAARNDNGVLLPVMKCSFDNPEKTTNPGIKQMWRIKDKNGMTIGDVMCLDDPANPDIIENGKEYRFWHPAADYRHFHHKIEREAVPLLKIWVENGKLVRDIPSLIETQNLVKTGLESFDNSYKRFLNPHIYKVSITERLRNLKLELIKNYLGVL